MVNRRMHLARENAIATCDQLSVGTFINWLLYAKCLIGQGVGAPNAAPSTGIRTRGFSNLLLNQGIVR